MHVVERWTRPNKNTLRYEATIDDPGAYTAPWTMTWNINWQTGTIDEYICQENNQYLNHLKDDFGRFIIDHGEERASSKALGDLLRQKVPGFPTPRIKPRIQFFTRHNENETLVTVVRGL